MFENMLLIRMSSSNTFIGIFETLPVRESFVKNGDFEDFLNLYQVNQTL